MEALRVQVECAKCGKIDLDYQLPSHITEYDNESYDAPCLLCRGHYLIPHNVLYCGTCSRVINKGEFVFGDSLQCEQCANDEDHD